VIILEILWEYRLTWGSYLLAVAGLTTISMWDERRKRA
jgi:hypothetical protein